MNKAVFGIPVVLMVFVVAILLPLLAADYLMYKHSQPVVETKTVKVLVVVTPTLAPTATPSATPKFRLPTKGVSR